LRAESDANGLNEMFCDSVVLELELSF
jgi:hypothetical protein